ncbi:MAG: hypothetical protein J1E84_01180 [Muribaculaceae bacterium]|nr:hypothetical protein [Muribaculaceae bacterium]
MYKLLNILLLVMLPIVSSCGGSSRKEVDRQAFDEGQPPVDVLDIFRDTVGQWGFGDSIAPARGVKLNTRSLGAPYADVFNDSNYLHWDDAVKIGIDPITDTYDYWNLKRPVVKIVSCADFYVDELNFSKPYLVPEAAAMVHEIGRRFRDELAARGGGDYRFKITSVMRTADDVRRLRRRNSNAVDSSVHQLGTTVDISYARFIRDSQTCIDRSNDDLKALLAEILYDMRNEGKCLVKYEIKQPCFHISARPSN